MLDAATLFSTASAGRRFSTPNATSEGQHPQTWPVPVVNRTSAKEQDGRIELWKVQFPSGGISLDPEERGGRVDGGGRRSVHQHPRQQHHGRASRSEPTRPAFVPKSPISLVASKILNVVIWIVPPAIHPPRSQERGHPFFLLLPIETDKNRKGTIHDARKRKKKQRTIPLLSPASPRSILSPPASMIKHHMTGGTRSLAAINTAPSLSFAPFQKCTITPARITKSNRPPA